MGWEFFMVGSHRAAHGRHSRIRFRPLSFGAFIDVEGDFERGGIWRTCGSMVAYCGALGKYSEDKSAHCAGLMLRFH
jgi:hypothetical protein